MAVFKDKAGNPVMPTVDDDGAIQVAVDDEGADNLPDLLKRLIWETRELRRAYCFYTKMAFKEFGRDLRSDHV